MRLLGLRAVLLQTMRLPDFTEISFAYLGNVVVLVAASIGVHWSRRNSLWVLEVVGVKRLVLDARRLLVVSLGELSLLGLKPSVGY